MLLKLKNKEHLIVDEFKFKCSIGKKGLKSKKKEKDNCTPIGTFSLGPVHATPSNEWFSEAPIIPFRLKFCWLAFTGC